MTKKTKSVSVADIREFTRAFAELLAIGASLDTALTSIIGRTTNKELAGTLMEIRSDVLEGYPLSRAMIKYDTVFDRNYVEMVRAGELSGDLDDRLTRFLSPPDLSPAAIAKLL